MDNKVTQFPLALPCSALCSTILTESNQAEFISHFTKTMKEKRKNESLQFLILMNRNSVYALKMRKFPKGPHIFARPQAAPERGRLAATEV